MIVRRSPCEKYIKYLLQKDFSEGKKIDEVGILIRLEDLQLDGISPRYIRKLFSDMSFPDPFLPRDERNDGSRKLLWAANTYDLFFPDESVEEAHDILNKPREKEFVETLLLSAAPIQTVVKSINLRFSQRYTKAGITKYKEIYWNVDLLDSAEMRALLELRGMTRSTDESDIMSASALHKVRYQDARRSAANLPFSPLTASISLIRMGFSPTKTNLVEILNTTRMTAMLRCLEVTTVDGIDGAEKALKYAAVAEKCTNMLEQVQDADEDLKQKLAAISVRNDPPGVTLLGNLRGDHTVELLPEHMTKTSEIEEEPEHEEELIPEEDDDDTTGSDI